MHSLGNIEDMHSNIFALDILVNLSAAADFLTLRVLVLLLILLIRTKFVNIDLISEKLVINFYVNFYYQFFARSYMVLP